LCNVGGGIPLIQLNALKRVSSFGENHRLVQKVLGIKGDCGVNSNGTRVLIEKEKLNTPIHLTCY
jgi:hypothetical protein